MRGREQLRELSPRLLRDPVVRGRDPGVLELRCENSRTRTDARSIGENDCELWARTPPDLAENRSRVREPLSEAENDQKYDQIRILKTKFLGDLIFKSR